MMDDEEDSAAEQIRAVFKRADPAMIAEVDRRLAQRMTPTPVGALRIPVYFEVVPGEAERITKIIADAVTQQLGEVEVKVLVTPVFKADEVQVER